jgi:ATP-dependent DNA helicase RecG
MISLDQLSVQDLRGVGPAIVERLSKLHIHTVQDILFHLPLRYQDRTRVVPLRDLREGDDVVIEGEVMSCQIQFGKKRQLKVVLSEGGGSIELRFFYFTTSQKEGFKVGTRVRCFGEVRRFKSRFTMMHPEYRLLQGESSLPVDETLRAIYPSTEGLAQVKWQQLTTQALELLAAQASVTEYLPSSLEWMPLVSALQYVHRPPPEASVALLLEGKHAAQQRLAFEELLAHHLSLRQLRNQYQQYLAPHLKIDAGALEKFFENLGFDLTTAQRRVWSEIESDLAKREAMLRLVQGDVGCGKTVIAALAALMAVKNGYQVVVMAPTELLAEQHFQQFQIWFEPLAIRVESLTGSLKAKARRDVLENTALGLSEIVVGTHALFQKAVQFKKLGLVIIDEQHRFGVEQRLSLREKGQYEVNEEAIHPHQLLLTATPIPRSLAMASYADLDISVVDELPPGRIPITTIVINNERREEIIERVQKLCEAGGQVYWVCPLIEESDNFDYEAAEKTVASLTEQLPSLNIALVHGRLSSSDKEAVMQRFKAGEVQLLVATTVIEVGVNVPNASLIIIENAERLGLSQLHQLRGRVGRGAKQSYTVLLYQAPLSPIAEQRLGIMRSTQDGFVIAQKDLELRGPGELLGTRQTGDQQYRIANFWRDKELLPSVKKTADYIFKKEPDKINLLIKRWIGRNERFVNA